MVKHEYTRIQQKLRAYFILTLVCGVCDAIGFLIQLIRFGKLSGDERADVLLIVTCYIFLIVDFYYVCWVKNMTQTLPGKYKEHASAAILGFGHKFKRELSVTALKAKDIVKKGGKKAGQGVKKVSKYV